MLGSSCCDSTCQACQPPRRVLAADLRLQALNRVLQPTLTSPQPQLPPPPPCRRNQVQCRDFNDNDRPMCQMYTVQPGDTATEIAQKYKVGCSRGFGVDV